MNPSQSDKIEDVSTSPPTNVMQSDATPDLPLQSEDVGNKTDGNPEKKEHTRSRMAILFVLGFFAILFLCFGYAIMVEATIGELKDTLVGVIGALSGILGFIVGYYYKSTTE